MNCSLSPVRIPARPDWIAPAAPEVTNAVKPSGNSGDYTTTPDIDVLARGIEDGITKLLAVASSRRKQRPGKSGRPRAAAAKDSPSGPAAKLSSAS